MGKERGFPTPYEVETPAGAEGWEEMYPYHYLFTKEHPEIDGFGPDGKGFWYRDSIHLPYAMYPIEALEPTYWRWLIGEKNTRILAVPPAGGVPQRILNGYLYNSSVNIEDPDAIKERSEIFTKRIAYYIQNWKDLIDQWKISIKDVINEVGEVRFPDISQIKYADEAYLQKGYGPADEIYSSFLKLAECHHKALWQHFQLQDIGYMGYMNFHETCKKHFPKISDYRIATMLRGFEADAFRGEMEISKLAKLTVELQVENVVLENEQAQAVFSEMEKSENGRKWLEAWKKVEDPWLLYTGVGYGLLWFDILWKDDLNIPMRSLREYVKQVQKGQELSLIHI